MKNLPRSCGRVVLRRLEPADLPTFQRYRHDPAVGNYQAWEPEPDDEAARFLDEMSRVRRFPRGAWIQLALADGATNALVGDVGVCIDEGEQHAEIGFTLARDAQGSGLGTEAVRGLIRFIFEQTGVTEVFAVTDQRNTPSGRLLELALIRSRGRVESVESVVVCQRS